MNVKTKLLGVFILAGGLLLAGCGGTPDEPPPTPVPTLTAEERAQEPAGSAANPLRMIVHPVDTVAERMRDVLSAELGVDRSRVIASAPLRDDLGASDNLSELNAALQRDFDLSLSANTVADILTVGDLTTHIHREIGADIAAALLDATNLYFEVIPAPSSANALSELCASGDGIVNMAWLGGVAYRAGTAQNCGQPALQIARDTAAGPSFEPVTVFEAPESTPETTPESTPESTPELDAEEDIDADEAEADEPDADNESETDEATTDDAEADDEAPESETVLEPTVPGDAALSWGVPGVILADTALGTTDVQLISGRVFCRLSVDDFFSWFVPALVMQRAGLDPVRSPSAVVDYPDTASLVEAVAAGDCAATGLSADVWDSLDAPEGVRVINTTVPFPHGVLLYPLEIDLGVRLSLDEAIINLPDDPTAARSLELLLGAAVIIPAEMDELAAIGTFLDATGLDFAQLGN